MARLWGPTLALLLLAAQPTTGVRADPPRVLVLYPETARLPAIVQVDEGIQEVLRTASPVEPRTFEEYIDERRFPGISSDAELARWWAYKYRDSRPDAIIAVTSLPLRALRGVGNAGLWPGVPIVFAGIDESELKRLELPPNTTGVVHRWFIRESAELIHRLVPGVRRIVAPYGSSSLDLGYREIVRAGMADLPDGLVYEEWNGLTVDVMRERVRRAPSDAAIFILGVDGDRATPSMTPQETVQMLAAASPRPIFAGYKNQIGTGIVGGIMLDPRALGQRAAEIVLRILAGESAASIPIVEMEALEPVIDARQLARFGISRSALPARSIVLFDEESVFERYRWQILTGLSLLVLQTALIAVLLEQRRRRMRAQGRLDDELRFEQLVSDVATTLSHTATSDRPAVVTRLLGRVGRTFGADCAGLVEWPREDEAELPHVQMWQRVEHSSCPFERTAATLFERGVAVRSDRTGGLSASADGSTTWTGNHAGLLAVPLVVSGARAASLGIGRSAGPPWTDDEVERLRTIGQPVAAWVQRLWAESDLRSTSALNEALVAALASQAAIVDAAGVVWWLGGAPGLHLPDWLPRESGTNVLKHLEECPAPGLEAERLRDAILLVLDGTQTDTIVECRYGLGPDDGWLEMRARALARPERGVAVTFHDITRRKQLELDHQVHLQEMAHLDRVASLGALATSLAHELNQPLTAILANAQAAQVLLGKGAASRAELDETLSDIVEDDRRAGDIIHRMRRLLKKGDVAVDTVDLNAITLDAIRLVSARAARERVVLAPVLSREPVLAIGDSVQLQQVIVNLLVNAIDASAERANGRRHVAIATRVTDGIRIVSVHDSGSGIDQAELARIFKPFYSTKETGLGMGLSISRTIVEAHRGRIWAENGEHGAVFYLSFPPPHESSHFSLPAVRE